MHVIKPIVGQWYRGSTNELFEVVAIDDQDQTIEIQYFDGTVTEVDFDSWNEQRACCVNTTTSNQESHCHE